MDAPLHPARHLGIIQEAVARLRDAGSDENVLNSILEASGALASLASSGRAGCSAAEIAVSQWTRGQITSEYDAGYDVLSGRGTRLEVKFSKLNRPNQHRDRLRWNWTNILGNNKSLKKTYDVLVLVGQADPRFLADDIRTVDGMVVFAIPRHVIENKPTDIRLSHASRGTIALSADPALPHTRAMMSQFARSEAELELL